MTSSFLRASFILAYVFTCPVNAAPISKAVPSTSPQTPIAWLWDADTQPRNNHHVAIVTEHILLTDERLLHRPRASFPIISKGSLVTPLVHVEFDILHPPPAPIAFHDDILHAVLRAASRSTSGWVQLDYEARPSHRTFYKALVHDIKAALPLHIKLSVTALAWWCMSDMWLDDLDADEVVPMFFRMGKDGATISALLDNTPQKLHARCRAAVPGNAIGFSVQEPPSGKVVSRYAKIYWFNYRRWRENSTWPPIEEQ